MFNTVEQIRDKFIKDGWNESVSFQELSMKEAKEKGYLSVIADINNGRKCFKMNICGNIYDDKGKLIYFNI